MAATVNLAGMKVTEMVKAICDEYGWSQKELASRIGVDSQTISNWRTGKVDQPQKSEHRRILNELLQNARQSAPSVRRHATGVPANPVREGVVDNPRAMFTMDIRGDCMSPDFPDRAIVLLRPLPSIDDVVAGRPYFFQQNASGGWSVTFKRVARIESTRFVLDCLNKEYPDVVSVAFENVDKIAVPVKVFVERGQI